MHRESDTHGPRQDDTLKQELEDMLRTNGPTHNEEWQDQDPLTEETPQPPNDPTANG